MFIAKSFAKKHYKGAMDAMKSLSGKAKNEAALVKLAGDKNYSKLRVTLDYKKDLHVIKKIVKNLKNKNFFSYKEVINELI